MFSLYHYVLYRVSVGSFVLASLIKAPVYLLLLLSMNSNELDAPCA